jgi:thiamine biosynthesis protein ThiS
MMRVTVNGVAQEVPEEANISILFALLQVIPARVAVEVNLEIVPRASYDQVVLKEDDQVEIISFVGGGGRDVG